MKRWSRTAVVVGVLAFGASVMVAQGAMAQMSAKHLIERKGCLMCHSLNGKGGKMGPPMQSIAAWSNTDRIIKYIHNPKSMNPKSIMPTIRMSDAEIESIANFLMSFKGTAKAPKGWKKK